MCDFNEGPADTAVSDFSEIYNVKNIIRENIYFKIQIVLVLLT